MCVARACRLPTKSKSFDLWPLFYWIFFFPRLVFVVFRVKCVIWLFHGMAFFGRAKFTFPAVNEGMNKGEKERGRKREKKDFRQCRYRSKILGNGEQNANGLLFIVNIGPVCKVFMLWKKKILYLLTRRFINMCLYMWNECAW